MIRVGKKFVVFDIWSQYAHFKKPYTTTSPLTFSVPPRTAISGILAAVSGIDKNCYPKYFTRDMAEIAVGLKSSIKKVRIAENLINTKESMTKILSRTQIKIEFLKNPCYRIYFRHTSEEIYNNIKSKLENHSTFYTVSLGLSENLANFNYIGEFEGQEINVESRIDSASVVPLDVMKKGKLILDDNAEYFTENIPLEMLENRHVSTFREVLFERNAKKVLTCASNYIELKDIGEKIFIL